MYKLRKLYFKPIFLVFFSIFKFFALKDESFAIFFSALAFYFLPRRFAFVGVVVDRNFFTFSDESFCEEANEKQMKSVCDRRKLPKLTRAADFSDLLDSR